MWNDKGVDYHNQVPGVQPHKYTPNMDGYCMVGIGGGEICGNSDGLAPYHIQKYDERGYPGLAKAISGSVAGVPPYEPKPLPEGQIRVQSVDDVVAGCIRLEIDGAISEDARRIVLEVLPATLELFLRKNAEYGVDEFSLGPKAEFVRIWNKVRKLKAGLWDSQELEFEQVSEILDDLIGHLLLARLGLMG
jgi:hypothetical protein